MADLSDISIVFGACVSFGVAFVLSSVLAHHTYGRLPRPIRKYQYAFWLWMLGIILLMISQTTLALVWGLILGVFFLGSILACIAIIDSWIRRR